MKRTKGLLAILAMLTIISMLLPSSNVYAAKAKVTATIKSTDAKEINAGVKYTIKNPDWGKEADDYLASGFVKFVAPESGDYVFKVSNVRRPGHKTTSYECLGIMAFGRWDATIEDYKAEQIKFKGKEVESVNLCSKYSWMGGITENKWKNRYATKLNVPMTLDKGESVLLKFRNVFDGLYDVKVVKE